MRKEYKITAIKEVYNDKVMQEIQFKEPVTFIIDSKQLQFVVGSYYRGFLLFNDNTHIELNTTDDKRVIIKDDELIENFNKTYKY